MNRTRRVAATVVAATGLLGAAGAAAATIAGPAGAEAGQDNALAPAAHTSAPDTPAGTSSGETADGGRGALADYVATMSRRADRLDDRVGAAERRLSAARATRARLLATARAHAAALAREQATAAAATAPAARQQAPAPATHTSTGASSAGPGDDHGDDHGEGGHDD
ncbi:MAG: hypothetical protein ACXV4A_10680 [Actinomycetes bacterium]